MKNLKLPIFVVAVAAALALLAAASASATTLTGSGGTTLGTGTEIKGETESSLTLHPPIGDIECSKSSFSGKTTNAGSEGVAVNAGIESLSFSECNATVAVLVKGEIAFEGTGSNNGTLKSSNTEVTVEFLGFHCIFKTSSTSLGTITGSATTGSSATLDISATIPRTGGRAGAFCGSTAQWTGSYKFTTPSTLNIDGGSSPPKLEGEAPTAYVGETATVTWRNTGGSSATVNDETSSDETIAKTVGSACGTIGAGGSCTSRKVECLKEGEATLTARDTTASVVGEVKIKCDKTLTGEAPTPIIGETVTVTWKNNSKSSITIEDESTSNSEVAKTVGSGCETIKAESSCTTRKIECLKEGEATITARDTPSIEGKVTIKCDKPPVLTGEAPTGHAGETITVTWKNTGGVSAIVNSETSSNETIAKTVGSACGTIAAGGSCTSRKIECLKEGEATITAQVTSTSVKGEFKVKCDAPFLTGEALAGAVGGTVTVTWKNDGESSLTINDETVSDETVAKTVGSACGTIAGTSTCTSRKIECLKKGEATVTARDTTAGVIGEFKVKCNNVLEGSPTTGKVGETVTVTWTNNGESAVTVEDESTSDGTVAETIGSSCGEIAATGTCTKRKIKCLKAGESTITAVDTPSIEGKFVIKCS
jgi:hypothetical protein